MYTSSLKPFVFNANDLEFILAQIKFRPLFDAAGNAIIKWNGTGAVYDGHGNQIWDGTGMSAADAMSAFGTSYNTTTSLAGLRDVQGWNNNLNHDRAEWGRVDQPFLRMLDAEYELDSHGHVFQASETGYLTGYDINGDPLYTGEAFYANKAFANAFGGAAGFVVPVGKSVDYAVTAGTMGEVISENIVDYTPRMISRTITTGGVTFLTDVNGDIDYSNGVASVTDWGLLGSLGIEDAQARFDGSPGTIEVAPGVFENERFIGAQNPGVSPTNGWFTLFGQFFDHGLDFIDKGAQGKTIKIALAEDDPLYGVIGPDGMPATSITISRANVAGFDDTGTPLWTNHTSPFIDQSQTYGSNDAITELLREWVIDPVTGTWRPGMNMLDCPSSEHSAQLAA